MFDGLVWTVWSMEWDWRIVTNSIFDENDHKVDDDDDDTKSAEMNLWSGKKHTRQQHKQ